MVRAIELEACQPNDKRIRKEMRENGRLDLEKENTLVSLGIEELGPNARYSITKSDPDNAVSGCRNVLRSAGNASTAGGNALSAQVNALGASGNLAKAPDDVSTASGNVLMHAVNGWGPTGDTLTARS